MIRQEHFDTVCDELETAQARIRELEDENARLKGLAGECNHIWTTGNINMASIHAPVEAVCKYCGIKGGDT